MYDKLAIILHWSYQTVSQRAYFEPNEKFSFHLPYLLPTMSTSNSASQHPLSCIGVPGSDVRRLTISDILSKSKKCLKSKFLGIPEGISYLPHLTDAVYMCYVVLVRIPSPPLLYHLILPLLTDPTFPLQSRFQ